MYIEETEIKLNPDGSIDTAYHAARGRHMRGEQAHALGRGMLRGLFAAPIRVIRLLGAQKATVGRGELLQPGE